MRINPQAKPDDGLLDVCIVHGITRLRLITAFPGFIRASTRQFAAFPSIAAGISGSKPRRRSPSTPTARMTALRRSMCASSVARLKSSSSRAERPIGKESQAAGTMPAPGFFIAISALTA